MPAGLAFEYPGEKAGAVLVLVGLAMLPVIGDLIIDLFEGFLVDDRRLQTGVDLTIVIYFSDVGIILEDA